LPLRSDSVVAKTRARSIWRNHLTTSRIISAGECGSEAALSALFVWGVASACGAWPLLLSSWFQVIVIEIGGSGDKVDSDILPWMDYRSWAGFVRDQSHTIASNTTCVLSDRYAARSSPANVKTSPRPRSRACAIFIRLMSLRGRDPHQHQFHSRFLPQSIRSFFETRKLRYLPRARGVRIFSNWIDTPVLPPRRQRLCQYSPLTETTKRNRR